MIHRSELDFNEWHGYKVDQFVRHPDTKRVGRIARFVEARGVPAADIRWWRDNPDSLLRKMLKQVDLLILETDVDDPRKQEEQSEEDV